MTQLYLDFTGPGLRDAGIRLAHESTESHSPGWSDRALDFVRQYAQTHVEFLGEDVRTYAEACGFEEPKSKRAWGGVMLAAARQGIVVFVRKVSVKNPKAHCANASLWRSKRADDDR